MKPNLAGHFVIQTLNREEFWGELSEFHEPSVSRTELSIQRRSDIYFVLRMKGEIVGWHYGETIDSETYQMHHTMILPPYRGRGLYTLLLNIILAHLRRKGLQNIVSRQPQHQQALLIPKLKAGFQITGLSSMLNQESFVELQRSL